MTKTRLFIAVAALFAMASAGLNSVAAQGVTTGAIAGTVTDENGAGIANAQVQITNRSTGFSTGGLTREGGSFMVQGLETGGPYTVTFRRIGYQPVTRDNQVVQLTQTTRLDVRMNQQAAQLSGVVVRGAVTTADIGPSVMGTKTVISDTILQRKGSLTRNLTDFIAATPQVSTAGPGYSAGGMSNRMNNVQIDGATERDAFGLGSTGQPGGQISAKAISIDAVKEFQVLLAPFDVRQGNFGGLLLNAVTKSGTNAFHGSAFRYYRDQDYGRNVPTLRSTQFNRDMYGFSLGGPILRDKLHFFTANEWQRESTPVSGPYFGQPAGAATAFGFTDAEIDRFTAAYKAKGGEPGTAGIENSNTPMNNLFGRLDFQINEVHRLVARFNYTDATNEGRRETSRNATRGIFSSNFHSIRSVKRAPVLQLFSNFKNGWSNELFAGGNDEWLRRLPRTNFPEISVTYSGSRFLRAGADRPSQGNELDQTTYEITDNLSMPRGNHTFVVGTRNELVKIRNAFKESSYGVWSFPTIDAFEAGAPDGFRRGILLSPGGNAFFDALQSAVYAQDQWAVSPRLNLSLGIRADNSRFLLDNSYAPSIDSAYGHHETPTGALQWSPRVGFNWDATGDQVNQIRGGIGLFVGTPPYVWLENAYAKNGKVLTLLQCGSAQGNSGSPAPAFNIDPTKYDTCADGKGSKPVGEVNFLDKDLKFPQPMRANLAYDRLLGANVVFTLEGLFSKTLNQFFFVNKNLAGQQATDKFGRVLYGTLALTGISTAIRPAAVLANGGTARFNTAFDIVNQSKDYAYNLTTQLRKRYSDNWEALIAYSYGHAYDNQSFTSSTHASNWNFGRTYSSRQDVALQSVSLFDQPHKVSGLVTRTFPWADKLSRLGPWAEHLATDVTLSYIGVSGSPHDYVYTGSSGRGDMNADGLSGNDLIYIPKNVSDQNEIRFGTLTTTNPVTRQSVTLTPNQQAAAFDALIASTKCLSEQRGTIMKRNTCRLPFYNRWDLSVRQDIPLIMGHRFAIQADIFNFGNMLNKNWGQQRVNPLSGNPNIPLLTHTAMSSTDPATAVPTVTYNPFNFDPALSGQPQANRIGDFPSNYWRLQLAGRYSF